MATGENIFKYREAYEFKQQHWFKIEIYKNDNTRDEDISFYVRSCSLPNVSFDSAEVQIANFNYKAAGRPSFNDNTITFIDALDDSVAKYFYDWQLEIFNPDTGIVGRKKNYARRLEITEISPEGDVEQNTKWTFRYAWPTSIDYGSLDYGQGDAREISVDLAYDFAERGK